ncbi:hypothetical protein [Streptomyces sp. NPDC002769]|uniref:hypothetical protein n=1 Tax=Streptomyces sp. NPDC002769 TaxID=3154542 RepID=UPI00331D95AC
MADDVPPSTEQPRSEDIDKHSPEQMAAALHLIYYGTPSALNPYFVSGGADLGR